MLFVSIASCVVLWITQRRSVTSPSASAVVVMSPEPPLPWSSRYSMMTSPLAPDLDTSCGVVDAGVDALGGADRGVVEHVVDAVAGEDGQEDFKVPVVGEL